MKSFWVALVLFLLLLGVIIFNNVYINRTSERLVAAAEALPSADSPDCAEASRALAAEWERVLTPVSFSSVITKTDAITNLVDSLCVYAETGDAVEYERVRRLLINAFTDLAMFESFAVEDVF